MDSKDTKSQQPGQSGKRTIITIAMEIEDAKRLEEAIAAGKLAHLGIVGFQRMEDTDQKTWATSEAEKKRTPKDASAERKPPSK